MYPKDKVKNYERKRNRWFEILFAFSMGSFFNLIPSLDFADPGSVTNIQWLFVFINITILAASFIIYIYYWFRIKGIRKEIEKRVTSSE